MKKKRVIDKEKAARGKARYKEEKKRQKQIKKQMKKEERSKEKETGKPVKKWILAGVILIVLSFLLGGSYLTVKTLEERKAERQATEAMLQTEAMAVAREQIREHQKEELLVHSGKGMISNLVDSLLETLRGIKNRPPFVELTEENKKSFATVTDCLINTDTGQIDVTVTAEALPKSDDGYYYLFSVPLYENGISGDYITRVEKDTEMLFSCQYTTTRLYQKFGVAVLLNGTYQQVSGFMYPTNPEVLASRNPGFYQTSSKKGLLVDPAYVAGGTLSDLGVKHAAYNIPLSRILGATTHGAYPTIHYTYNGVTYAFNGHNVNEYDFIFSNLTNKGIEITAILLNDMTGNTMQLVHPQARSGGAGALYYAFNTAEQTGIDTMAAVGAFLAERYSGTGHGKVMNWVVSNEINARHIWNYISYMDVKSYSKICADSIRVFYNSIKSKNGNARVYVSIDQQWDRNRSNTDCYDAKDMLDEMNSYLKSEGNIDWCVAQHPYNYPLTGVKAWNMGKYENLVTNSPSTSILTMKNIQVLTDYLQQEHFLNSKGEVRRVILSEVGYTSTSGQELQSANFVYAYKKIEKNPYIDSILLNRQSDHAVEVAQGLALGLQTTGGGRKHLYQVFKYIDTPQASQYCDFALNYVGLSSWSQIQ